MLFDPGNGPTAVPVCMSSVRRGHILWQHSHVSILFSRGTSSRVAAAAAFVHLFAALSLSSPCSWLPVDLDDVQTHVDDGALQRTVFTPEDSAARYHTRLIRRLRRA